MGAHWGSPGDARAPLVVTLISLSLQGPARSPPGGCRAPRDSSCAGTRACTPRYGPAALGGCGAGGGTPDLPCPGQGPRRWGGGSAPSAPAPPHPALPHRSARPQVPPRSAPTGDSSPAALRPDRSHRHRRRGAEPGLPPDQSRTGAETGPRHRSPRSPPPACPAPRPSAPSAAHRPGTAPLLPAGPAEGPGGGRETFLRHTVSSCIIVLPLKLVRKKRGLRPQRGAGPCSPRPPWRSGGRERGERWRWRRCHHGGGAGGGSVPHSCFLGLLTAT